MAPTVRQSGSLVRFTFVKTAPQKGRLHQLQRGLGLSKFLRRNIPEHPLSEFVARYHNGAAENNEMQNRVSDKEEHARAKEVCPCTRIQKKQTYIFTPSSSLSKTIINGRKGAWVCKYSYIILTRVRPSPSSSRSPSTILISPPARRCVACDRRCPYDYPRRRRSRPSFRRYYRPPPPSLLRTPR